MSRVFHCYRRSKEQCVSLLQESKEQGVSLLQEV